MNAPRPADIFARQQEQEREQALRALLMRPLLTAADAELALVRRHAEHLRAWLAREAGWVLKVERDCARLYKLAADLEDGTRGAPGFDRRRYVLLCLVCAVLERADPQVTLKTLGERVLELAADPQLEACGFAFRLASMHERRELVDVCRFLLQLGVLARVAGEEEGYVQQRGGDALYDVARRALAGLLACTRGPSTFTADETQHLTQRLAALTGEYRPDDAEGRRTAIRHRLARRLLDDPVVYHDELGDEEREYFANQRGAMAQRLRAATGMEAELRAEGTALVDPHGELTDSALPAEGTQAHVTLLVAQFLAERARSAPRAGRAAATRPATEVTRAASAANEPRPGCTEDEIAAFVRAAAADYGRYWRKGAREPGAETELAREALAQLAALRLLREEGGRFEARPALLRFAFAAARTVAADPQRSLLDPAA
jgi:uncharacterized protein (TIGR02678 family)